MKKLSMKKIVAIIALVMICVVAVIACNPSGNYNRSQVASLRHYIGMTMGGVTSEATSKLVVSMTMDYLDYENATPVPEPAIHSYGLGAAMDTPENYYSDSYYSGYDRYGRELFKYHMYGLLNGGENHDLPELLVYDEFKDLWYDGESSRNMPHGDTGEGKSWEMIKNTAV